MSETPVNHVTTLAEAVKHWEISRSSIIWAYWNSSVVMRKSEGTWLVEVESLIEEFGKPKKPLVKFG